MAWAYCKGLVEFLARGHELVRQAWIAERGDVWREEFSRAGESNEFRQHVHRLPDESPGVVRFFKRNVIGGEPAFQGLFRCLVAVVDGGVERAVRRVGDDTRR